MLLLQKLSACLLTLCPLCTEQKQNILTQAKQKEKEHGTAKVIDTKSEKTSNECQSKLKTNLFALFVHVSPLPLCTKCHHSSPLFFIHHTSPSAVINLYSLSSCHNEHYKNVKNHKTITLACKMCYCKKWAGCFRPAGCAMCIVAAINLPAGWVKLKQNTHALVWPASPIRKVNSVDCHSATDWEWMIKLLACVPCIAGNSEKWGAMTSHLVIQLTKVLQSWDPLSLVHVEAWPNYAKTEFFLQLIYYY